MFTDWGLLTKTSPLKLLLNRREKAKAVSFGFACKEVVLTTALGDNAP